MKILSYLFFIAVFSFALFVFGSSGYNTYQYKFATSINKFEREFTVDKVSISQEKYQDIRLTGIDELSIITLSVDEIPINKRKFVVVYETFKQPNGKQFTTLTFGGYR